MPGRTGCLRAGRCSAVGKPYRLLRRRLYAVRVVSYPGGFYVIVKLLGRNTNIGNAPVTPNVDSAHVLVEIESGGTGICYDGGTAPCTGSGNTQTCKVQ